MSTSIKALANISSPTGSASYTPNDFRQTLRITYAGISALSISSFFNVSYGLFFVVFPMMLLSLVPRFSMQVVLQVIAAAVVSCFEIFIVSGFLWRWPLIMTAVVFILFVMRFRLMSQGPLFLFGSMGVVFQCTMLNLMSYPSNSWHTLLFSLLEASFLAVILYTVMTYVFPDVEPRQPPPKNEKTLTRIRHESLLSGSVATISFLVFQVCDLSDSLSALMASVLVLFPMNYRGIVFSSLWRIAGVTLSCIYVLVVQIILYNHSSHMLLIIPLVFLGLAFSAKLHSMEKVGSGVGFCCITTIGIMFGQNIRPDQDLVFSDLYRLASVAVSLLATLTVVFLVHRVLNRIKQTSYE